MAHDTLTWMPSSLCRLATPLEAISFFQQNSSPNKFIVDLGIGVRMDVRVEAETKFSRVVISEIVHGSPAHRSNLVHISLPYLSPLSLQSSVLSLSRC